MISPTVLHTRYTGIHYYYFVSAKIKSFILLSVGFWENSESESGAASLPISGGGNRFKQEAAADEIDFDFYN